MQSQRLVVVSNRVPPSPSKDRPWLAGGLVSALLPALEASGNALWFGWSGETGDPYAPPQRECARGVDYATVDLSAEQVQAHYEGYCNRVLWPLFHGLAERVSAEAQGQFAEYRSVNRRFAGALFGLLEPGDLVWIHDYHLISVGAELRRLGWQGRLGYFNHTPLPEPSVWTTLEHADTLAAHFAAYDVVGVQTERDARRLRAIVGWPAAERVHAYPISINPERLRMLVDQTPRAHITDDGDERRIFFGVDRLDYSKAIPQRIEAFGRALDASRAMRDGALFVQWAAPSRENVPEYQAEREAVEAAAQRVQDAHGEAPLELLIESQPLPVVAAALTRADVCVVTSVADGMNLVAKEFAALHSEERPGVLVLSDSCGAAEELTDALIFPAGDQDALARALVQAFEMPEAERRERARRLRAIVDQYTSAQWMESFVGDLAGHIQQTASMPTIVGETEVNTLLRRRVDDRLGVFQREGTIDRIWARDYHLWKPRPDEISNRLGWLDVDRLMAERVSDLRAFAEKVAAAGYTTAVLLGMGGSSLAPRVFGTAFGGRTRGLELHVLDSTVPDAVRALEERVDPARTLFIVSSKSGTTIETRALLDYFWSRRPDGRHFVAITDPGTPLASIAEERGFRRLFLNPSDIGGRYSALSYVGLVPAALLGVDLDRLLASAAAMRRACEVPDARSNPGARLGAMLAEAALMGRDCLTLQVGPELGGFGAWLEQLIAESTGKDGVGILPVFGNPAVPRPGEPDSRFLMAIGGSNDTAELQALASSGSAVARYQCADPYHLGAEYFRWEFAVAVAGHILGINPFDQPDVEASKREAARILEGGQAAPDAPMAEEVLERVEPGQYLALHAYLPRSRENTARLRHARSRLRERLRLPTTVEYGPALLHSTGQFHKGGPARGVFIQVVEDDHELAIPGRDYSFEDLKNAQAAGDLLALAARDRLVSRTSLSHLEAL